MPIDLGEPSAPADPGARPRYAGRAVLLGVLGIALIVIGTMMVAMLQAPVVRPRVIVTGFVLIGVGLILLPLAWMGRRHRGPD